MYVLEAHEKGGAHVHCILEFDRSLPFFSHVNQKGDTVLRLSDEVLRKNIKSAWGLGHTDIQVVSSNRVADYMVKELCKNSSIEKALERIREGRPLKNDTNRIWGFYFIVLRLKIRAWGRSRNIEPERLDSNMNNSTEKNEEICIEQSEVVFLSKKVTRSEWFKPMTGIVERGSVMERELSKILDDFLARKEEIKGFNRVELSV
jgi:hypothetical protein